MTQSKCNSSRLALYNVRSSLISHVSFVICWTIFIGRHQRKYPIDTWQVLGDKEKITVFELLPSMSLSAIIVAKKRDKKFQNTRR